ncbi:MAG: polyprenyl synthetase family protein [Atribacterota bacterium]
MELSSYMKEKKRIIDRYLEEELPLENQNPSIVHRSIRYSVLNGGKRIRPMLTMMVAELLDQDYKKVLPAAAGIELIHTFSLVHDDLPSMDDDDYRRGKLTNHKVFGEAMAILTGDALLVMGLDFICRNAQIEGVKKDSVVEAVQNILKMLGTQKMLGGQVDDINWHNQKNSADFIEDIYSRKTSALICASLKTGALLLKASKKQIAALETYGEKIGLAFQIIDDIIDLQEDKKIDDKPTYPVIFGLNKSEEVAHQYCNQAKESISLFGEKAYLFSELADFVVNRKK